MLEGKQPGARAFCVRANAPVVPKLAGELHEVPATTGAILPRLGGVAVALAGGLEVTWQLAAERPENVVQLAHDQVDGFTGVCSVRT